MKYVGYIRVSDEDQVESGLGLSAQESAIREYVKQRNGVLVEPISRDEGLSGRKKAKLEKRPGLMTAVSLLERGDVLLVAKRDRFARDAFEARFIEDVVIKKQKKARLVSVAGEGTDGDDDNPANFFIKRFIDLFAEYESLLIGSRIKAALIEKKKKNEFWGGRGPPYGYDAVETGELRKGRKKVTKIRRLVQNPKEQSVLKKIYEFSALGFSERRIAEMLNNQRIKTRIGKKWFRTQVHRILVAKPYAPTTLT